MPSIRLLEHRPGNTRGGFFVGMGRQPVRYELRRSNYSPWAPRPVACFRSAYGIRRDAPAGNAYSVRLLSLPIHSARYRSCGEPGALFVGMGRQPMRYELRRSNYSLSSSYNAPKPCHSEEAQGADVGISCINVSTNRKPINMEYPNDSMLIKLYMIIPSCWRLPRRHFMPPRNDMETGWLAALKMVRNVSKNTVIANQCAHWCGDRRECLWCNP